MSITPAELRYATASHEWVRLEEDGSVSIGITDHAQQALGDVVYVELPEIGRKMSRGEVMGVVESVKAASDIYAPISGEVLAINLTLSDSPEQLNDAPYNAWIFNLQPSDPSELDSLLDAAAYQANCEA